MDFTGYIEYKGKDYTFHYKDNYLTLIIIDQTKDTDHKSYFFRTNEKIDFFKGYTSDGFAVSFYIDGNVSKWYGTYRCYPKLAFLSKNQSCELDSTKYDSIKFVGGLVDKFYSNKYIFKSTSIDLHEKKLIEFRNASETKHEEKVIIDGKKSIFQISVANMGWKNDGSISFTSIPSVIRLILNKSMKYEEFINQIITVNNLLMFCSNRRNVKYDKIIIETKKDDVFYESIMVHIPLPEDNVITKNMIDYLKLENKLNKLIKVLSDVNYLMYRIPESEKELSTISAGNYTDAFSCYQSVYNYINMKDGIVCDQPELNDVKKEMVEALKIISDKYKGKDSKKRGFADLYINRISSSKFTLENMIIKGIEDNEFLLDTLPDKSYKEIMFNYKEAVNLAVKDRDFITHDDVFAPSDTDIAVYMVLERLIYIFVMKKIGINKKDREKIVRLISNGRII